LWMASWWVTEAIPIYVTALLPIVIFPTLSITNIEETSLNYAHSIIFLFLGGFLLAQAVEKSNLHKRFAYTILKIFGTDPKFIVAAFMVVTWFLGAWMSNTAVTILMLPIALAVISLIDDIKKQSKFVVCLLLSVAYSASISGVTTLIGSPPNAIFATLANSLTGTNVTFSQWLLMGLPISSISLLVLWLYLIRFGSKITDIKSVVIGEKDMIKKKLFELGPISRDEKIVAIVFIITAAAWISRGLFWKDLLPTVDDSTIAIASAISLFLLPSSSPSTSSFSKKDKEAGKDVDGDDANSFNLDRNNHKSRSRSSRSIKEKSKILDWQTAVRIPWGVLILIGGGLALANAFTSTGLGEWMAAKISFLGNANYLIIILVFVTLAILPTEMISNTATAALLIPIAASFASSIHLNPILLMAPVAVATSYGFIMPVGTPPNAIVFSTGYLTIGQIARAGLPLDLISIALVTLLTSIFVPLIFGI
jgi:sodium-dependent dicarboxylate transporter 2/3/5